MFFYKNGYFIEFLSKGNDDENYLQTRKKFKNKEAIFIKDTIKNSFPEMSLIFKKNKIFRIVIQMLINQRKL